MWKSKKIIKAVAVVIIIIILLILLFALSLWISSNTYYNFITYIIANRSKILKPIESRPDLLNKPFKEFYINSSHNSYISDFQNATILQKGTITKVLQLGARCIELDIHNKNGVLVVAHGNESILTTTSLPLTDILQEIKDNAFKTSDPLFLTLEIISKDPDSMSKLRLLLIEYFQDKMLDNRYKLNYTNEDYKSYNNATMGELLNKIIIQTSRTSGITDIIDRGFLINYPNTHTNSYNSGYMYRIYLDGGFESNFSFNFDPEPFWKNRCNMIALNFNSYDKHLYTNMKFFEKNSFIHFSEYNTQ